MVAIAIIPARGGSKRLPRKNIADFLGKPIIKYTIEAAHISDCFERVVVSTDDNEIAAIARESGAETVTRPPSLATDSAPVHAVCLALLEEEKISGRSWTQMACLYATAPMRNARDIRATMALLKPGFCDFAMGVSSYDKQPQQALKLMQDQTLIPMWPDMLKFRASDLPPLRASNGTIYAVNCDAFRRHGNFYGPNLRGHDMPRTRAIDIDTLEDLELARLIAQNLSNR